MVPEITDDIDVAFRDWGEPILLRTVTRAVDEATGAVAESSVDSSAVAIFAEEVRSATPEASRTHHRRDAEAVVRTEVVPSGYAPPLARVVRGGVVYEVSDVVGGADGVLTELSLRVA